MGELKLLDSKVCTSIDSQDEMYAGNKAHYFSVGQSALKNILIGLMSAEVEPASILDLPCGHGRVLRYLAAKFPEADITACDLNQLGVDFCRNNFGAKGIYSSTEVEKLNLEETYDLIWCGSLVTHLDSHAFIEWLYFFSRHLKEKGIVVFTTHGRFTFKKMALGDFKYGLDAEGIIHCLKGYKKDGYGYANYPNQTAYGISISSPPWILKQLQAFNQFRIVSFTEQGWDNHQDVVILQSIDEGFATEKTPDELIQKATNSNSSSTVPFDETTPFDESFYLRHYPDVMSAVKNGLFSSGYEHYQKFGWFEGRIGSPPK